MTLAHTVDQFLRHLHLKGFSPSTIGTYARIVSSWISFLTSSSIHSVEAITSDLVRQFIQDRFYIMNQYGRQNAVKTRNIELSGLKSFLTFIFDHEKLAIPLASQVSYYRESRPLPKDILTQRELKKLFALPDLSTLLGYRDRMIFELLYATGIRKSELLNLALTDFDWTQKTVLIRSGKGQKDRVVPIHDRALGFVKHYIQVIRPKLLAANTKTSQHSDRLILTTYGLPLSSSFHNLVLKYCQRAKLKKKIGIHSFRHTCATHLIQANMPLRHVQELLGHDKLTSTTRYLQLHLKDLQKEYKRCHPRNQPL